MSILFLFLDGVGLGPSDTRSNPFSVTPMPALEGLLGGRKLLADTVPFEGPHATLLALDAAMGVEGLPQSASGQAAILTGRNVPAELGYHYGPKPNEDIRTILKNGSVFARLKQAGKSAALLGAYPPGYFAAIQSGKRMYSAVPMAVTNAGIPLMTQEDYFAGRAMAADLTGEGWRTHLNIPDAPVYEPAAAGHKMAELARQYDFAFFEYWLSDYIGHRQDWENAQQALAVLDSTLKGLLDHWDFARDTIILTSDHGNLEDLSVRRHTGHLVPGLIIGSQENRQHFAARMTTLADLTPAILDHLL